MRYICKIRIESRAVKTYSHTQKSVNCSVAVLITNTHRAQWSCLQHSELDQHKILHFAEIFLEIQIIVASDSEFDRICQILLAWDNPDWQLPTGKIFLHPQKIRGQFDKINYGKTSNTTLRILSVRGVPPPPLRIFFRQKRSYGFGGYPPPFTDIFLLKNA